MRKSDRARLSNSKANRASLALVKPSTEPCLCDLPDEEKGKVAYNEKWCGACDKCGLQHRVEFREEVIL